MGSCYGIDAEVIRHNCERTGAKKLERQKNKAEVVAIRLSEMLNKRGTINMRISVAKVLRMAGGNRIVRDMAIRYLQNNLHYNIEKCEVRHRMFFGRVIRMEPHYVISAYCSPSFGTI